MPVSGWIGVDLDGTLAEYGGWNRGGIGPPVPAMVERVKRWLAEGTAVRIVTARVGLYGGTGDAPHAFIAEQTLAIERWCMEHIGRVLPVTASKDFGMIELWDDRCVPVEANTGRRLDGRGQADR